MTATQAALPLDDARPEWARDRIGRRWWKFHTDHPEVYDELVRLAETARRAGRKRVGIGQLFEVLRWNTALGDPAATYRLNNSYRALYVRLMRQRRPDLGRLFETRSRRSEAA